MPYMSKYFSARLRQRRGFSPLKDGNGSLGKRPRLGFAGLGRGGGRGPKLKLIGFGRGGRLGGGGRGGGKRTAGNGGGENVPLAGT